MRDAIHLARRADTESLNIQTPYASIRMLPARNIKKRHNCARRDSLVAEHSYKNIKYRNAIRLYATPPKNIRRLDPFDCCMGRASKAPIVRDAFRMAGGRRYRKLNIENPYAYTQTDARNMSAPAYSPESSAYDIAIWRAQG